MLETMGPILAGERFMDQLNLKDKVVIVTGGSKGIGYAISHVIAAEGGIPFIVSRNEKSILETVKEISEKGGKCSFAVAELTDPDQCKASVQKLSLIHI